MAGPDSLATSWKLGRWTDRHGIDDLAQWPWKAQNRLTQHVTWSVPCFLPEAPPQTSSTRNHPFWQFRQARNGRNEGTVALPARMPQQTAAIVAITWSVVDAHPVRTTDCLLMHDDDADTGKVLTGIRQACRRSMLGISMTMNGYPRHWLPNASQPRLGGAETGILLKTHASQDIGGVDAAGGILQRFASTCDALYCSVRYSSVLAARAVICAAMGRSRRDGRPTMAAERAVSGPMQTCDAGADRANTRRVQVHR